MEHLDLNQNLTQKNGNINKEFNSILTQHEDLRRATLLKHRKVSTQLKMDMVQRQLSCLRRSHTDSETARQFYRSQMAELSSELQDLDLNTKSGSPTNGEEDSSPKDSKPWKAPLKFLGNLVDSRIRRKLWGSSNRTKSVEILDDKKDSSDIESKDCNGFGITDDTSSSSSSSSESNDEDEVEEIEEWRPKRGSRSAWKAPVARKISNNQKAQIDPAILAEIEDFEKMAAQYIKQHS
ncbi:hypothetical protein AVEN_33990-1 [Araneus ventricosus]|uniref:Uncharacterized protein n=1 Tax=Araneus ventricosus TaxID=182803 RepID=A0A4Y2E6W0_ARAVE|nr:hypothetical protein AVEN_33990-1 [Araneus ventricosus]